MIVFTHKAVLRPRLSSLSLRQHAGDWIGLRSDHPRLRRFFATPLPGRQQDILLLRNLLLSMPPLSTPAPSAAARDAATPDLVAFTDGASDGDWRAVALARHLRAADTRALFDWLVPTAAAAAVGRSGATVAEEEARRYQIAARLPATSFSELLRCLDPAAVYAQRDDAQELVLTAGLAQFTPLGALVDRFGVRTLYPALLRALLGVVALRLGGGSGDHHHRLLLHDYSVLLRCAGAAADMAAAKRVWHEMEPGGLVRWRQAAAYAAFAQARFLTEPLYTQHDTARLRVRPGNLHRQKLQLSGARLRPLERLRRAQERDPVSRFGQRRGDEGDGIVEPLARVLRKTRPVYKVLSKTQALGHAHDERLLAALIVAFGRTGSLAAVERILADFWKVRVVRERRPGSAGGGGGGGGGTVVVSVSGGAEFAPDAPMRPTAVLLAAVVQAYGCHGEVACALQVLGYLARRYNIAVPPRLWHDLLAWTYLLASRPVADEWRLAGFPGRVLRPRALALVWKAMVESLSASSRRPGAAAVAAVGLSQHHLLVKMLLAQRRLATALQLMRAARPLYQARLRAHEAALLAHAAAVRQGLDAAARAAAATRLRRAAARKWHMRYCLQVWCRAFLRAARPRAHDDPVAVRLVPRMVEAFWPFLPHGRQRVGSGSGSGSGSGTAVVGTGIRYRTVAGVVELREPLERTRVRYTTAVVDLPALRPSLLTRQPPKEEEEGEEGGEAPLPFSVSFETTGGEGDRDHDRMAAGAEAYVVEARALAMAQATAEAAAAVDEAERAATSALSGDDGDRAAARERLRQQRHLLQQRQVAEEHLHAQRLVRSVALRRRIWIRSAVAGAPKPTQLGRATSRAWLIREFA